MKPLYYFVLLMALFFTGYFIINDFNFDNISFSNYLINTLFVLLLTCVVIAIAAYLFAVRRKHLNKDVMTIRQYYQYKSAR
jgi:Tfp pilus assembly protein PilO